MTLLVSSLRFLKFLLLPKKTLSHATEKFLSDANTGISQTTKTLRLSSAIHFVKILLVLLFRKGKFENCWKNFGRSYKKKRNNNDFGFALNDFWVRRSSSCNT